MLRALLSAFALALFVSPVHGQLGALKKRAEKAVAAKVAPQTTGRRATPVFDDVVVELTESRITKLLVGFAAEAQTAAKNRELEASRQQREAAYQRQREEYERAYAQWETKKEVWQKCVEKYNAEYASRAARTQSFTQTTDTMALKALALRIQRAQERGDMAEARRLSDSLASTMGAALSAHAAGDDIQKRAEADCGKPPEEPTRPEAPGQPTSLSTLSDGARASGIPEEQYRIARERILAWLSLGDEKITSGETTYAFSDAELAALGARRGDLRQYESVLSTY